MDSQTLTSMIRNGSKKLDERIRSLEIAKLPLDPFYRDRYLQEKIEILESSLIRSRSQLAMALADVDDPARCVLIDHGGGTGTTGMLAKLSGVGTVIYNDIDVKFLETARIVGLAVGAVSDHYVAGDVDVLELYLASQGLIPDALISYDVIEHIQNMDAFFEKLGRLTRGAFTAVMSSGANMFSPRYLRSVLPVQRRAEIEWRNRRAAIIRELVPDMTAEDIVRLARSTRKHIRPEIERAVSRFRSIGVLDDSQLAPTNRYDPYGTNTCNPDTGWWAEHLMNPWQLRARLAAQGFEVRVLNGRYGRPASLGKRIGARVVNLMIGLLGPVGITMAAYYTLWARRRMGTNP